MPYLIMECTIIHLFAPFRTPYILTFSRIFCCCSRLKIPSKCPSNMNIKNDHNHCLKYAVYYFLRFSCSSPYFCTIKFCFVRHQTKRGMLHSKIILDGSHQLSLKSNMPYVGQLSSKVSVNCLQFCR